MLNFIIGIDNGVTGTIAILKSDGKSWFCKTPVIKTRDYTKGEQYLHRINVEALEYVILPECMLSTEVLVIIERPMVNPRRFKPSCSALRALEATLICLEKYDLKYIFIDSKEWQQHYFASKIIGSEELKKASMKIGIELFPEHAELIKKHGDADSLLMAKYYQDKM